MTSETKIAIPVMQETTEDIINTAKTYIKKGADILELRLDRLGNVSSDIIKETIEEIAFPIIANNRSKLLGGYFLGNERERIDILKSCCDLEFVEYIDIDLQTDSCLRKCLLGECEEKNIKTIISFHDFEKTPPIDDLIEIVNEEKLFGDIAKIAVMPKCLKDTISVLTIMSSCNNTIAISMGELGSYTRLMASKFNAPITFATAGDMTAPGQINIEIMELILNRELNKYKGSSDDI